MYQLTRIQAVNQIMKLKTGERVTTNGELDTIPQAVEANDELDIAVGRIQTDFEWFYNTVDNGVLTADGNGEAVFPDNLSYVNITSTSASVEVGYLRPVTGKIYNTYSHTYDIGSGSTVNYTGKLVWEFEDLPAAFQNLAVAQARMTITGGGSHFSPQRLEIETKAFNDAFQTANKFDNFLSGGRVRNPMPNRRTPPGNRSWL